MIAPEVDETSLDFGSVGTDTDLSEDLPGQDADNLSLDLTPPEDLGNVMTKSSK